MEYLYNDGESFIFMDINPYDQLPVPDSVVGDDKSYLLENTRATVATHEGNPLYIEMPPAVELEIVQTDPGVQGDRSTGGTKPDRKSTRLNSSHVSISYAVFCLKKKTVS